MMTLGTPARLTIEDRRKLATWAVKTTLVLDRLNPKARAVPESEYRRFYELQSPLNSHDVWIGGQIPMPTTLSSPPSCPKSRKLHSSTNSQTVNYIIDGLSIPVDVHIHILAGYVVFQVFGHNFARRINIRPPDSTSGPAPHLWPGTLTIDWPTSIRLIAWGTFGTSPGL